jgi:HEPN domain-containing protein
MSTDEQAAAYLDEARLTLTSARAIYRAATAEHEALWADVVKNGYDAIEQAVSAGIAAREERIPRAHPAKIQTFVDLHQPPEHLEEVLLHWLQRRSDSQYVDIRGDELNVPHRLFDEDDAGRILEDAETVIDYVTDHIQ